AVSVSALAIGLVIGTLGAWAKIAGTAPLRATADTYTTVLRGFPDLLVIYLFYFGGSAAVTAVARQFGATGFVGAPAFLVGALAVGIISGAYQTEVLRGAVLAAPRGRAADAALRAARHGQCLAAGAQGIRADLGHRADRAAAHRACRRGLDQ